MVVKYKVIESDMPAFEDKLNEFASKEGIKILDIKYSTSGLAPDEEYGWHTENMHNALISYRCD